MGEEIINTSIKEIKDRWINYCVNTRQHRAKTKDYKDLQYIDKLVIGGLDNDTINKRLERYRKIRITNESLNKKKEEFEERMSKPSKRIILSKRGKSYLHHFEEELKDNPYYNQKLVWCNGCGRTHRINSDVAWNHNTKPIPIKCEVFEDHCWKSVGQKKRFGVNICLCQNKDIFTLLTEGYIVECIVCGKKGLVELTFITDRDLDITNIQLKEIERYVQSIKDLGFEKINDMCGNKFKGDEIGFRIPEFDKKIREIQNIDDYTIINLF